MSLVEVNQAIISSVAYSFSSMVVVDTLDTDEELEKLY